jgi:predicted dehydrogenase
MRFLIVGLGSMGKRRIRCLKSLKQPEVAGYDQRADRREEAKAKHGITVFDDFDTAVSRFRPDALIISVPPDVHGRYIREAITRKLHFFVEASVLEEGLARAAEDLRGTGLVAAPSATMVFHPGIRLVDRIVKSGRLGRLSNILLHSGQYLPDWHTYEKVGEYYVSNPATGGGREIVPFELTWFVSLFGYPRRLCANYRKTIEIEGAPYIDDTYNLLMDYGSYLASVTVDVVSRYATRRLLINGSLMQLVWSWDENVVKLWDPRAQKWETHTYTQAAAADGYNANIGETMYIEEMASFISAVEGRGRFPNTLEMDLAVLGLLTKSERSDRLAAFVEVSS